jgi:hypothetical protein
MKGWIRWAYVTVIVSDFVALTHRNRTESTLLMPHKFSNVSPERQAIKSTNTPALHQLGVRSSNT